jgi:hypothetical protein
MDRNRRNVVIVVIFFGAMLAFGVYQFVQFQRAFAVKDYRVVQILESQDGQLKAELIRRHALFDLNFIIRLNGRQIYRSEDFRPNYTVPFRETILWDKTGENLIFEVAGQRLFGYNVTAKRKLLDKELRALQVQNLQPGDFH